MTPRLTLDAPVAVLAANNLLPQVGCGVWLPVPTECPRCDGNGHEEGCDGGCGDDPASMDLHGNLIYNDCAGCGKCDGSGRNPLVDLAGRPCPQCDGTGHVSFKQGWKDPCLACGGSGGLTVEIWTDEQAPSDDGIFGDYVVRNGVGGRYLYDWRTDLTSALTVWSVSLGVQVGTCTITAAVPIEGNGDDLDYDHPCVDEGFVDRTDPQRLDARGFVVQGGTEANQLRYWYETGVPEMPFAMQWIEPFRPFGLWEPGRTALQLANVKPT